MKIKITALALSALLPLSAWAASEPEPTQPSAMQHEQHKNLRHEKMQKHQDAWFDRLDLNAEQCTAFKKEMTQHREQQHKARTAHHDKLRSLLNDEQRAAFDKDTKKMQERMKKHMQKGSHGKHSGDYTHKKHHQTSN